MSGFAGGHQRPRSNARITNVCTADRGRNTRESCRKLEDAKHQSNHNHNKEIHSQNACAQIRNALRPLKRTSEVGSRRGMQMAVPFSKKYKSPLVAMAWLHPAWLRLKHFLLDYLQIMHPWSVERKQQRGSKDICSHGVLVFMVILVTRVAQPADVSGLVLRITATVLVQGNFFLFSF